MLKDGDNNGNLPAVAAKVDGDETAFYSCAFKGVQDTLFDKTGRHYFYNCYIQGEVDFIFGNGQSIYEVIYPKKKMPIIYFIWMLLYERGEVKVIKKINEDIITHLWWIIASI